MSLRLDGATRRIREDEHAPGADHRSGAAPGDSRELVSGTLAQLGMICWFEGRYEEGSGRTRKDWSWPARLKAPALIFSNQIMLANVLHGMGPMMRRWNSGDRALDIALRDQDAYGEVLARAAIGRNLLMLRRSEDASNACPLRERSSSVTATTRSRPTSSERSRPPWRGPAMRARRSGRWKHFCRARWGCGRAGGACQLHAGYAEALVRAGEAARDAGSDRALAIAKSIKNPWLMVERLCLKARLPARRGATTRRESVMKSANRGRSATDRTSHSGTVAARGLSGFAVDRKACSGRVVRVRSLRLRRSDLDASHHEVQLQSRMLRRPGALRRAVRFVSSLLRRVIASSCQRVNRLTASCIEHTVEEQ